MVEKIRLASAGSDIKVWELPGLTLVDSLSPHSQPVTSICWSDNNQNLASVGADKVVVTYMKKGMNSSTEFAVGDGHCSAAFNSTSRYLLVGGKAKTLSVWDLKSKSVKKTYKDHKDTVSCVQFNWNDTSIASGSVDGTILLHNVVTAQASAPLRQPKTQAIRGLQYSHFKKSLLASVSDDGALNMWDTNARKLQVSFSNDHKAPATALAFSPVNEMLLTSVGLDKKIVFYDVQGKKSVKVITADSPLTSVDFLHDGVTLVVGTTRGKICSYDLRSGSSPVHVQAAHMSSVQCLKFQYPASTKNATSSANKVTKSATHVNPLKSGRTAPPIQPEEPKKSASLSATHELSALRTMTSHQNGIKEEEVEIFSPIREAKSSTTSTVKADDSRLIDRQMAVNGRKETRTVDSSGIFSPLASNTSAADSRHHPGPAYSPTDRPATTSSSLRTGPSYSPTDRDTLSSQVEPIPSTIRQPVGTHLNNYHEAGTPGMVSRQDFTSSHTSTGPRPTYPSDSTSVKPPSDSSLAGSDMSGGSVKAWSEADLMRGVDRAPPGGARYSVSGGTSATYGSVPEGLHSRSPRTSPFLPRKLSSGSSAEERDPAVTVPDGPDILRNSPDQSNGHTYSASAAINGPVNGIGPGGAGLLPGGAGLLPGGAGLQPFQVEFIKNMIDDSMDEFRMAMHRDVVNLQVEMLRQFHMQQIELRDMMEKYSVNEALVAEIERLREENRRLKTKY